jgi:DHA1 family tetracycline resistance protein-like MFS transporter
MQDYETPQAEKTTTTLPPPEPSVAAGSQHFALLIVFLVMFIDLLGFGIVLPLLPRYGREFLDPLFPGREYAAVRGAILGLLMASFSAMQFIFAPLWGRISDRLGRRPFLLLGLVGSVAFYSLFGFASDWGVEEGRQALGLILLFVARIGAGIAGATVSTAQAVIADSTTPERRSRGMALIGAAFGIGFTFGPMLGAGSLFFYPSWRGGPGYVAAAFSLGALVLAVVLMPETLRPGVSGGRRGWLSLSGVRLAARTPTVGLLILTFFLSTLAFANFEPTLAFLTKDVLDYGDEKNFLVFAFVGFVLMLSQGGFYQVLARWGMGEIRFMLVGALLMGLGMAGLGCAAALATLLDQTGRAGLLPAFLASLTAAVIGFSFVTPSVQALVSRRSDPAKQGEILGVNQSANALSRILGPMAGVCLYYLSPAHILPYTFALALLCGVFLLTLRVRQA